MARYVYQYTLGVLIFFVVFPVHLFASSSTLQVCVIANPTDTCDFSTPGGSGGSSGGSSGGTSGSSGGGGGGGGGGGASISAFSPTYGQIEFHGMAYPSTKVTLLRDGVFVGQTTTGPDARFVFSLSNVTPGTYTYSLWSEDQNGFRSYSDSFSVAVGSGVGTIVSGIFLPPTITTDKSTVKKGDSITFSGQTVPNVSVDVVIHSVQESSATVSANSLGVWKLLFDSMPLEYGVHNALVGWHTASSSSPISSSISFTVGDHNVANVIGTRKGRYDLSGDGKVNLIDFSILSYWYKRPIGTNAAGIKADINGDGVVDLKDFSILAYYWTG